MPAPTRRYALWIAVIVAPIFLWITLNTVVRIKNVVHRSEKSPDGRYSVVVYRLPVPFSFTEAGVSPGVVRLQDASGKTLVQKEVPSINAIQKVEWLPGKVAVRPVVEWDLPPGVSP